MSCKEYEGIEEQNMKGKNLAYIRIGKASILVCACDHHFNQLRMMLGMDVGYHSPVVRVKDKEI